MRRSEIAIDASRADSAIRTGTEWYSYEVIRALTAIDGRPPLTLYHRSRAGNWTDAPRVRHRLVRPSRLWTHLGLSAAMLRDRPAALFVPSHVIPLVHPRRSIVTIHDLGYRHEPGAHTRSRRVMLELTTRWNARVARRVIAVSGQTRDDLINDYRTDPGRIRVIHSGIDHDRFRPLDPAPQLSELGIRQPYILFLSTVQPRKNVARLIDAFEQLHQPGLHLVIAGKSGWLSEPIEERIRSSSAVDRIVRLDYVADDAVPALYNGAKAFVLPSLYEGFGMGILEAMACACPVVTSDRSAMPEIAGSAAVLVDPTDIHAIREGIEHALSDSERERLIRSGLERAAAFTWERTARETLAVIQEALDER
jgi:glycosyltransferase involved in cell wall biosynthesis